MKKRIQNYLLNKYNYVTDKIYFSCFKKLIAKYRVDIYLKDQLGILVKREFNDNFEYIFKTKYSCDATPFMIALNNTLSKEMICFDIGANIGITTIWMAKKTKKVYAFEPETMNLSRLRENLTINNISNVVIEDMAVSNNCNGSILNVSEDYGHHSLGIILTSNKIFKKDKIKTVTIDSYCQKNDIDKIDLLKVDVEGYEYEVLMGCQKMLMNKKIKRIIFEISNVILKELNKSPEQIIDYLYNYGYVVTDINGKIIEKENINSIMFEDLISIPKDN